MIFDFSREINRTNTGSLKHDGREDVFGTSKVAPLWVADMDFPAPPSITVALVARAHHPVYGYTLYPDSLYQSLIDWLRRRHGWEVQQDWIVMCPGVVPTIHASVMAYTDPGGSVIVQPPVYFPFFSAVTGTGRELVLNPLQLEGGRYHIDFDHLEECASGASLMLLCSPHNPVGRVWSKAELERLLKIAQRYDLVILSDEIHADLVYPENRHTMLSLLAGNSANIVTAVAPSKTFNIPGLNLSALIVPDPKRRASIIRAFDTVHVSASNPFSVAAFEAAYRGGEEWLDQLIVYLRDTRDFVEGYLSTHLPEIRLIRPEGTYLLWLDCRELAKSLGKNDSQMKHFFVNEAHVGMSPGTLFGEEGSGFMRMNIGAPRQIIAAALESIKRARYGS